MKTIDELAQEAHDRKKTGIPYADLKDSAKEGLRAKAAAKKQADELLAVICEKSKQEPAEVISVVEGLRELGYVRDLPALTVED